MKIQDRGESSMEGVIVEKYGVFERGWRFFERGWRTKNIILPCGHGL